MDILTVCLIGSSYVGKSSLYNRERGVPFESYYSNSIGVDIIQKELDDTLLKLIDTNGDPSLFYLIIPYLKFSNVIMFVFSLNDFESFSDVVYWINIVKRHTELCNISLYLLGNKSDTERTVCESEINLLCSLYKMKYKETNCKNIDANKNVFIEIKEEYHMSNTVRVETKSTCLCF